MKPIGFKRLIFNDDSNDSNYTTMNVKMVNRKGRGYMDFRLSRNNQQDATL